MNSIKGLVCLSFVLSAVGMTSVSFAQEYSPETPSPSTYQPPTGEQPVFGKKYYPGAPKADLIFEINPAILIYRGLGFDFEKKWEDKPFTLGGSLEYRKAKLLDESGYSVTSETLSLAPKIRLYPVETLGSMFVGFKLKLGQVNATFEGAGESTSKSFTLLAPVVHVGYRFLGNKGFTLALYAGGGLSLSKLEVKEGDLNKTSREKNPELASKSRKKFNDSQGVFVPDIGISLGVGI
jgi:hypothetical protein